MYPIAAPPVPRIYRALALIQALIAALTLVGLVIWWMASYSSMGTTTTTISASAG